MLDSDLNAMASCYLFDGMSPEERRDAISQLHISVAAYPAGTVIVSPDQFVPALYHVISGTLAVTQEKGCTPVLMRLLESGESFGAASLFGCSESYPTTIRSQTAVRVAAITEEALVHLFLHYPEAAIAHIRFLSEKVRFLNERLDATTGRSVESKVSKYLLDTYGKETCHAPLNMSQVARNLDIGRASLYRLLTQFSGEGLIDFARGQIRILALEKLKRKAYKL